MFFWFRLSHSNLYYTRDNLEMIVLGAINIHNIEEIKSAAFPQTWCFRISDVEKDNWILCAKEENEKKDWECAIKKVLGRECEDKTNYEVEI